MLGRTKTAPQELPLPVQRHGTVLFKAPAAEVEDAVLGARRGPVLPPAPKGAQQDREGQRRKNRAAKGRGFSHG
ncbi:hypothetical protein JCM14124_21690 [Humidesulfovibrio idahonensis]